MNFTVFVVEKKLEKFYLEAIAEYAKRLSRYCKIELVQVKNEDALNKKLSGKPFVINVLSSKDTISSEKLSEKIKQYGVSGNSDVSFTIGAKSISSNETLSISPMDMNPALLATVLYEQIYRSYRIMENHPYHK